MLFPVLEPLSIWFQSLRNDLKLFPPTYWHRFSTFYRILEIFLFKYVEDYFKNYKPEFKDFSISRVFRLEGQTIHFITSFMHLYLE